MIHTFKKLVNNSPLEKNILLIILLKSDAFMLQGAFFLIFIVFIYFLILFRTNQNKSISKLYLKHF